MAEKNTENPTTGTESDISKSQSQQQPPKQASQQPPETGEQQEPPEAGLAESEPADPALGAETATRQRTDIEGASLQSERGEAEGGFVGAEGKQDTSSELIEEEDEDDAEGGQGTAKGE